MKSFTFKQYLNELHWDEDKKWQVKSSSNPNKSYTVALSKEGVWGCSCPRWRISGGMGSGNVRRECKHIRAMKTEHPEMVHGKDTIDALKALGYTQDQIKNMTPEQMDQTIEQSVQK